MSGIYIPTHKRQMTWFRGMERRGFTIHWMNAELPMEMSGIYIPTHNRLNHPAQFLARSIAALHLPFLRPTVVSIGGWSFFDAVPGQYPLLPM